MKSATAPPRSGCASATRRRYAAFTCAGVASVGRPKMRYASESVMRVALYLQAATRQYCGTQSAADIVAGKLVGGRAGTEELNWAWLNRFCRKVIGNLA